MPHYLYVIWGFSLFFVAYYFTKYGQRIERAALSEKDKLRAEVQAKLEAFRTRASKEKKDLGQIGRDAGL